MPFLGDYSPGACDLWKEGFDHGKPQAPNINLVGVRLPPVYLRRPSRCRTEVRTDVGYRLDCFTEIPEDSARRFNCHNKQVASVYVSVYVAMAVKSG